MKVLQINSALITDAPGRIAEEIGKVLLKNGHEAYFGYGRETRPIVSTPVKIGGLPDQMVHLAITRLADRHGFGSANATRQFVKRVKEIDPDIIHLHNLHGYYINIRILFDFLKEFKKPVVWTLHDCWAFTGHCSHYVTANCYKWETECHHCPKKRSYPASWLMDNSTMNFRDKKKIFNSLSDLHFVSPSKWLADEFTRSFLKNYPIHVINNGIDISRFSPEKRLNEEEKRKKFGNKPVVLGVASVWGKYKGLDDFIKLNELIKEHFRIVLVGLNKKELQKLPEDITGMLRTESVEELASLYATADVFVNPTYADTFPTTNLEALACGTPVITYKTGGSPESVDNDTGRVVEPGDITELAVQIKEVINLGKSYYMENCRTKAEKLYDMNRSFLEYISLYESLLNS